jgi:hypothetical protein
MSAATPATIASPPSPAMSGPDHRRVSASPSNSPQTAPPNAAAPAANSPRTAPVNAATPAASSPRTAPVNAATPAANPPQTAPLDAVPPAVTASTEAATTDQAQQPVPAAKKSQKTGRSANDRNRSWHDAAGWGRYAHERPTSSW